MDSLSYVNAEYLLTSYVIEEEDLQRVRALGEAMLPLLEEMLDRFYGWLQGQDEYAMLFVRPGAMESARLGQVEYWRSFFAANIDESYIAERFRVGETHARVGVSMNGYLAGMNQFFQLFASYLKSGGREAAVHTLQSLSKQMNMDAALVGDAHQRMVNERVLEQDRAMMEMSTPVTMIWEEILLLPIVGIIDSQRAQSIMEGILGKISSTRSRVFIMDISGVAVVDSAVANNLIKITKATRLMGCESLVSGLSPAIAQTIVHLGIDTEQIATFATLRDALEAAFRMIGLAIRKVE